MFASDSSGFHGRAASQPLERDPVLLAVELGHLRVSLPGDHVERLRVARDDGRHRCDRRLDPFAG
jgi:hypothetical protein